MKCLFTILLVLVLPPVLGLAETVGADIQREMRQIDALCADPDLKIAVVAVMADRIQVHRNHLLLLHKESGQPFATIFVAELRAGGGNDESVLRTLKAVVREMNRQLLRSTNTISGTTAPRPVLAVRSNVDYSSAVALYSLVPEVGIDSRRAAFVVGVPYYRSFSANVSSGGLGDVYAAGFLRGRASSFDFGSALTLGMPTGDRDKGFGAGKVSIDATGTMARRFESVRPWVSAGFANSIFNNVGYQRPYITDGNAIHLSGGVDFSLPWKMSAGIGGFGLEPVGEQVVYSQAVAAATPSSGTQQTGSPNGGGMMPGGGMGSGMGTGTGGGIVMPPAGSMQFYQQSQRSSIRAADLRDYGASAWLSVPLHAGLPFTSVVSRSIPFHATTVRVAIGADLARLLFPRKHF